MKRILLILTLVLSAATMQAQIGVASFSEDKTCQDARVHHPKRDKDGVLSALVKISTTEQEFNFETGSLGIVATEYKTGEVWLYLPAGTMKLKITHARLGSLEGDNIQNGYYEFNASLESGHVYNMKLTHERVQVVVGEQKMGRVTFRCPLDGTEVLLGKDQSAKETICNGEASTRWAQGQMTYTARYPRYADTTGTVVVDSNTVVNIALRPLFGQLSITAQPASAAISINDKMERTGKVQKTLDNGIYKVSVSQEGYHDTSFYVQVHSRDLSYSVSLRRIYGWANVKTYPAGATVYIDGQRVGTTPCLAKQLIVGKHTLRIEHPQKATIQRDFTIDGERSILLEYELAPNAKIQCLRDKSHHRVQEEFSVALALPLMPEVGYKVYMPQVSGLTLELGASCNLKKSGTYYIYSPEAELLGTAEYRGLGGYAGLGLGVPVGELFRMTPMAGVCHYRVSSSLANDPARHANGTGFYLSAEASFALTCSLRLFVHPQYHFPIHKSAAFQTLYYHDDVTRHLLKGFWFKAGIIINN